jgi:phospholipid transport system substrate-binding protein
MVIAMPEIRSGSAGCALRNLVGALVGVLVGTVLLLPPSAALANAPAGTTPTPEQRVEETSDAVLALIEQARGYAKDDPERFYREITALLDPAVDFEVFARSVMAVHYKDASPDQRQRFADTFKWGLVRTYALALTEFSNGSVRVLPSARPSSDPRMHSVMMEVVTPSGNVYPVQYAMRLGSDGAWRVVNIIVNGVNIGLTYRNQFSGAMRDPANGGSLDKVIDGWSGMLKKQADELEQTLSSGKEATGS